MLWILLEALIALSLLVGIIAWVMWPQKKRRNTDDVAPLQPADEDTPPVRKD